MFISGKIIFAVKRYPSANTLPPGEAVKLKPQQPLGCISPGKMPALGRVHLGDIGRKKWAEVGREEEEF